MVREREKCIFQFEDGDFKNSITRPFIDNKTKCPSYSQHTRDQFHFVLFTVREQIATILTIMIEIPSTLNYHVFIT